MEDKGVRIHLLKRLAIFVIPEMLLFLNFAFNKHVVNIDGVAHVTDAALGVAIFTLFFLAGWAIYLIIDMLLLFKNAARTKALVNLCLLIVLTIGASGLLINL